MLYKVNLAVATAELPVERLWRVATFSCVEVLAYCFMSNHFHILVYVPDPRELSDDELLARIRALYSGTALAKLRAALGLASANFFTARYLTPLAKSGYIAVAGGEKNRYLPGKQYRILRILPHHYGLVRPRSPQVVLRGRSF